MRIRIRQVNVPLGYDEPLLLKRVGLKVACTPSQLANVRVVRRSLDARPRNPEPVYVLTVEADIEGDTLPPEAHRPSIEVVPTATPKPDAPPAAAPRTGAPRPLVVGAGPAGLLAAYRLALAGARPIVVERGQDAHTRAPKVARFWLDGTLDPESNALFGEGGAGLFSDGKLTTRGKDRNRIATFMQLLHACGADESVLIDAEPHLGSDALLELVPGIRRRIEEAGGEVRFGSRLEAVAVEAGRLRAVVVNGEEQACAQCVLAVGHSARDVYEMLAAGGVAIEAKPFAVGVRLELPQAAIDRAQYGRFAGHALLGAASFRLTRRAEGERRACYSFCMCPGGRVIACASEPGMLTTNGMSYATRSLSGGNAAFLVPVGPADYPAHPVPALAGLAFQRDLESRAFLAAGGGYMLPAARLVDFLAGTAPASLPDGGSCTRAVPAELRRVLPDYVTHSLAGMLPAMLRELNGVKLEDAVLYASETRSSSPLRIVRGDDGQSANTAGLFPAGEGAGYAGGIVSSAVDGIRAAEHVLAARVRE